MKNPFLENIIEQKLGNNDKLLIKHYNLRRNREVTNLKYWKKYQNRTIQTKLLC